MNTQRLNVDHMCVLRMRHLTGRVGVSSSTIYDWMNPKSPRYDSSFPRPIKLGASSVGWLASDVQIWIESRAAMRQCAPGRLGKEKDLE